MKLAINKTVSMTVEQAVQAVTEAIKPAGFGILTRIDFDQKLKEKINESIQKTVILGACNPKLAHQAFLQSTDVALLIPCNIVIRDLGNGKTSVEAIRPSSMLNFLPQVKLEKEIRTVEENLSVAIEGL